MMASQVLMWIGIVTLGITIAALLTLLVYSRIHKQSEVE